MKLKRLLYGILVILIIGIGGLVYKNATERVVQPIACPVQQFQCPDGTFVQHLVNSCEFPDCPPPNVSLTELGIAFALPEGFAAASSSDLSVAAYYSRGNASTSQTISIRRFPISASSTALATIQQTAISGTSGQPVPITAFSSSVLGRSNTFTIATLERFEGVVDTAYYLSRGSDVLRFDAIDQGVANWTDPNLDATQLPANAALRKLLATLEIQ
jgi:hypothetical protein